MKYDVQNVCEKMVHGKFKQLQGIDIQLVERPKAGESIEHRYLGNGKYVVIIHDSSLLHGQIQLIEGALAEELTLISMEQEVPHVLRNAYRFIDKQFSNVHKSHLRAAAQRAREMHYSKSVDAYERWRDN